MIQAHEVEILTGRDVPFSSHVRRKCKGKRYIRVMLKGNAKIMPSAGENPECLKKVLNCKTQENLGE